MKKLTAIIISLFALAGCGPKLVISTPASQNDIYSLALLPREYPATVTRERVDYIYSALTAELLAHGYQLLDETISNRLCNAGNCFAPNSPAQLQDIQAFVDLKIGSASRNNFLAGYYNAISGTLRLVNTSNSEILRVEHTESERGGLLFNSGQLFRGLSTTADNTSPEAFSRLADKFAKVIVSKLPAAKNTSRAGTQGQLLRIAKASVYRTSNSSDEVCVDAPSSLMAYAIFARSHATLREVSPGHYCGRFRLDDIPGLAGLAVEVRSAYGASERRELSVPATSASACDLRGKVDGRLDDTGRLSVALQCSNDHGQTTACSIVPQECAGHAFRIFRAESGIGPFLKFGEFTGPKWLAPEKAKGNFQIVAIDKKGGFSVPVALTPKAS
ncbi:MAG: hypothetical protein K1X79_10360 [Oligoflexia bacterium]|nr:hypothetical protein [Oligoflexia bacterium]